MKLLNLVIESRIEDFRNKFSNKFTQAQISRIIENAPQKYLLWIGKNFDQINFEENFPKLIENLKKFEKISSNLPKTDLNSYKSFFELVEVIKNYENRPKREYRKVQGGNVVFDNSKYFVVNPQTHQASCYYGKGTKWCTASGSNEHFNRYNDDGKLFYILDRSKQTDDPFYKIALLKKFDGTKIFWDAQDQNIKNIIDVIEKNKIEDILTSIDSYMQEEYADQIKIFSDKDKAKREKDRLERLRILAQLRMRNEEAEERRMNNSWQLGPDCPEEGLKAHALLEWLSDNQDVEVKTKEDLIEIERLKNEILRLQTQYDQSEDVELDLLDEISDLEDQLSELENKVDVYNMYPDGNYYLTSEFLVLREDMDDRRYAVGTENEVRDSCYERVEELINDIGYQGFQKSFVINYLDEDQIVDLAEENYRYDVSDSPEVYFDESERDLSDDQKEQIQILKSKIEEARNLIEYFENQENDERSDRIEKKIQNLTEMIEDYESEIEDIELDPEGDFSDDLIDEKIEELVDNVRENPQGYLDELGIEWTEYINKDDFILGVIDEDGYGQLLNPYDGNADDIKIQNEWFYVMRVD